MPLPMHFPTGPYSLKILLASPKITLLQIQIFIIGLFQDLLFIGEFQQMVGFVKFVISGIQKVLFPLWFAVIAVGHHQIPMYILFHNILWGIEGILAFSDIFDDGCADPGFFLDLSQRRFLIFLSSFYGSFGKNPASYLFCNSCTAPGSFLEI